MREAVSLAGRTMVRREPVGVAAVIASWSYPSSSRSASWPRRWRRAARSCSTRRPRPRCPPTSWPRRSRRRTSHPASSTWSPGPAQVAEMLAAHPGVDIVAVAGPTPAGRRIAAICGETLKPVSLELGGKSAAIVLNNVDLDATATELGCLCFANSGQACFTMSRVLAPRSRYDEAVEALACAGFGRWSWAIRWPRRRPWGRWPARGSGSGVESSRHRGDQRRARGWWPAAAARPRRCAATTTSPPCSPTPTAGMAIARDEICGPVVTRDPVRRRVRGGGHRQRLQLRAGGQRVDRRSRNGA